MKEYSLLVVDDEQIAVWGITRTIDWASIGIVHVHEAYDVEEALVILSEHHIDIVISDIEMPGLNGIDLLKWIRKNSSYTKTIFLSAHSEFSYAQEAMSLGSINYILKPVAHEELKKEVSDAIDDIAKEYNDLQSQELYKQKLETWEEYVPTMVENFWYNILNGRRNVISEKIASYLEMYDIPLTVDTMVTPILVSTECFRKSFDKNQEIQARKLAEYILETIFKHYKGTIIIYEGDILVLIYDNNAISSEILNKLSLDCEEDLNCSVSFYIGKMVYIKELSKEYNRLSWMDRRNTSDLKKRVYLKDFKLANNEVEFNLPDVLNWLAILTYGKKKEFIERLDGLFSELENTTPIARSDLEEVFVGIKYIFLVAARKNGLLGTLYEFSSNSKEIAKSVASLREWTYKTALEYFDAYDQSEKNTSHIVQNVKEYVLENISHDFKREDIASALYFNPSYLSRVFKMEKGISLNEYVVQLRLARAKELFDTTNKSVSTVAMKVGYHNFSYFSKQFKDLYGMSPSEYKKYLLGNRN